MSEYKFVDEGKQHLHTLRGQPLYGTSTITGILSKPLTWWSAGLAVGKFGWVNDKKFSKDVVKAKAKEGWEKVRAMTLKDYEELLIEAYRAHSVKLKDSASDGVDLHAELESYVLSCIEEGGKPLLPTEGVEQVQKFADWAYANVDKFLFSEGHTFSEKYWVGGIVDAGAHMKNGRTAILDFKSSREAYYSQFVQIAGYTLQVQEQGILKPDGTPALSPFEVQEMIVVPFGSYKLVPRSIQNVTGFQEAFVGALKNYQLSQAYSE